MTPGGGAGGIARVVVEVAPYHLDRPFDYLVPEGMVVGVGSRVEVVFAGRRVRGLVVGLADEASVAEARLRPIHRALGDHAWVTADELEVLRWAARRFGAPLADVVRHALPGRVVDVERQAAAVGWFPPGTAARPPSDPAPDLAVWAPYGAAGRRLLDAVAGGRGAYHWRPLPGEDLGARLAELVQLALSADRDCLVLVPDPRSPAADRVVRLAADQAVDLRGTAGTRAHYRGWLRARCGVARVVVGERGAAFTPLPRLGLAVVLDEANPAHKERRSPRHHSREVALERARRAGGVGLTVGTVPSAVLWGLITEGRVTAVTAPAGTVAAHRPRVAVATGQGEARARLTRTSVAALRRATAAGTYGVVLVPRGGEGRAFVCRGCGERARCATCGAWLARDAQQRGACGACGWRGAGPLACAGCRGRDLVPLAAGVRRMASELAAATDAPVAVLEGYAADAPPPPAVLVTTRGSILDAPPGPVGAVVLADLDALLRRPALDAAEDALRLAFAAAGWIHRDPSDAAAGPDVVVETQDPEHHAVRALVEADPDAFWTAEAARRAPLRFPPHADAIRLEVRGDGPDPEAALRPALPAGDELLGPLPVEGAQVWLLKATDRDRTLAAIADVRAAWSRAGLEVRVEVDPVVVG